MLFTRSGPDGKDVLIRASLSSPIVEETLLSTQGSLGFAQLTVSHGIAVWGEMHEPSRARMFAARLDGTVRREIMPESPWAQLQWPRLAPDGSQLAYTNGTLLMRMSLVGAEAMPESEYLTKCASRCDFRWESSRTLLVIDGRDLVRVSIGDDGVAVQRQVADDVAGLAVAGGGD